MASLFNAHDFLQYLHDSPTSFHATEQLRVLFSATGFQDLCTEKTLEPGERFYRIFEDGAFLAGVIGTDPVEQSGFGIIATHTDWQTFRVKPNPVIDKEGLLRLNTEPYGGLIWDSWLDRPLGLAGRLMVREADKVSTRLFWIDEDIVTIPHVAMHIDSNANSGHIYSLSDEMLPVIGTSDSAFEWLPYLADATGISVDDILDVDAFLVPREKSSLVAFDQSLISAPHLDNLAMTYTAALAMMHAEAPKRTVIFAAFDYEEIGSRADTGADSPMLYHFLEEIVYRADGDRQDFLRALDRSFLLSADMAHAAHPAHPEKSDPTNRPRINGGPVIKYSARHSYTTTAKTAAIIKQIAGDIPLQAYVNRSEVRGGSTAGMHVQAQTGIRGIDMGCAVLGMHAFRELGGVKDLAWITELFTRFYAN